MTEEEIDALAAKLPPNAKLLVSFLREQNAELHAQLERTAAQLEALQKMLFGRRSEKMPPIEKVLRDEEMPTETVDGTPMPEGDEEQAHERRRHERKKSENQRKKNRERQKDLPVLEYFVEVQDEQLPVGLTRSDFREVGEGTIVERIEHIPARHVIQRFRLQTLAAKHSDLIIKAASPPGVSEGGKYGPGMHAHVITAKCCDSLPFYRIAKQLTREGNPLSRSVLCTIFHRTAECLKPVYDALRTEVRKGALVHIDETTLPVQAKGSCKRGWIWGTLSAQAITYTFDPSRGGEVAERLLGGTKGHVVADGYSGYNRLESEGRVRCGCWAHARRKIFDARSSAPEADELLKLIQDLYKIERQAKKDGVSKTSEHARRRGTKSRAITNEIFRWVAARKGKYPPKSAFALAIGYIENQKIELLRFLEDCTIPLDNNAAERMLRIIALGRKNFLFAGHKEGAQNLAILQSIVATCELHEVNPYAYIRDILVRLQEPGEKLEKLMPWAWSTESATETPNPQAVPG